MFPCSVGNHRYPGPQQSAYIGALNGTRSERVKQRLCPQHLNGVITWADQLFEEIDTNAPTHLLEGDSGRACFRCSSSRPDWALFVNVYPLKQEPRLWFGHSCPEHVNEILEPMGLTP